MTLLKNGTYKVSPDDPANTPSNPSTEPDQPSTLPVGPASGTFDKLGSIFIVNENVEGMQSAYVEIDFLQLESPIPDTISSKINLDVCSAETGFDDSQYSVINLNGPLRSIDSLSAGEVITISSEYGTFINLQKEQDSNRITYYDSLAQSPDGLSLIVDIPGDQFPSVQNLALPVFDASFTNVAQQLLELQTDNSIRWSARNPSEFDISAVILFLFRFDPAILDVRVITCYAKDDGEFTIPNEIVSTLDTYPKNDLAVAVRVSQKSIDVGNNAFIIYSELNFESLTSSED